MKIQNHQVVIPAKAGTQEKVEKKRPLSINWEKILLFQRSDWVPAFAGMTTGGETCVCLLSDFSYINFFLFKHLSKLMDGKNGNF